MNIGEKRVDLIAETLEELESVSMRMVAANELAGLFEGGGGVPFPLLFSKGLPLSGWTPLRDFTLCTNTHIRFPCCKQGLPTVHLKQALRKQIQPNNPE